MNSILPVYSAAITKLNCLPKFSKAAAIIDGGRFYYSFLTEPGQN